VKKSRTPQEIFEDLSEKGEYEEANLDPEEIKKVKRLAIEDYEFGQDIRKRKNQNWRIIFNINYDVIRELCSLLVRFEKQKISNHQGLFAFIVLNFKELKLKWEFFETIRNMINLNKYKGMNITQDMWKSIELKIDLYISIINKELEKRLK
jgi:hypothetical protein